MNKRETFVDAGRAFHKFEIGLPRASQRTKLFTAVAGLHSGMTMGRAFLGVERSLRGQIWRAKLAPACEPQAVAITQAHAIPDLLARILAARGQTAATCLAYLDPSLREAMPDPDVLSGMGDAVDRLVRAIETGEAVAIFGDYDVDGACSAALLADYLRAAGLRPVIHIPDRIVEGYGPNEAAIRALRRGGASLLVTVDCGTTSLIPLAEARALGLDCLVLDHHQALAELPAVTAVVNPNRQDDLSGLGHLCAAGVVFMVLVALHRALRRRGTWDARQAPDLLEALDLVALATVADVVPLTGLNRAFVAKGLAVMRLRGRPGLAALFDVAGTAGPPTAFHLGFLVGPRINAGGRIGDAGLGARLLLTRDPLEARTIAATLNDLNTARRGIEAVAVEEAEAAALAAVVAGGHADAAAVVTSGVGWHPGVVGLVAARLRERYGRPVFAIAVDGRTGTGSGRSIPGVDLGRAVREAVERGLLLKGGGHAMAAGITIDVGRLDAFRAFLHDRCGAAVTAARRDGALDIDAALSATAADAATVAMVDRAGPYGSGNAEPVFAFARHRITDVVAVGTEHLRLTAVSADETRLGVIAFRAVGTALGAGLREARGKSLHLAGTLAISRWGGAGRPELRLVDAAVPDQS